MTGILTAPRSRNTLLAALCAVYFASYFTRLGYATVISQIVVSEGILKSEAALATTACFVAYGAGQLFSGWLGDRISPKWLIFLGLAVSSACNLLLPLAGGVTGMAVIWGVNGLGQSLIWPPMIRSMACYLGTEGVERGSVLTSMASSCATVLLYLFAPGLLAVTGWRSLFYLAAALGAAVAAGWLLCMSGLEKVYGALPTGRHPATAMHGRTEPGGVSLKSLLLGQGLVFAMVGIVAMGTLRDGVATWLPSYLVEVFQLGTGSSILSSVVLPVFSIISMRLFAALHQKFFKNEIRFAAGLFAISCVLSLGMAAVFTASAAASVLLAALLTSCMHGINLMLICNLPARYANTGKVSLISGILNACTYVGSAVSTYGFALVAQALGWRATVVCWALVCLAGLAGCVAAAVIRKHSQTERTVS